MLRFPKTLRHFQPTRIALTAALMAAGLTPIAHSVEVPHGFTSDIVVTNINAATSLAITPDGRVFYAEQTGFLRVWKDGRLIPTPALDLSARVDDYWERGLIGFTFHNEFPRTPYLFVVYVAKSPYTHHVVSRFTVVGDFVDPASELILLEGDDQATLGGSVPAGHQGGPIRMGADGCLYVGLGEQTNGEASQSLRTLQGKILRLNADGSIPDDNPFHAETTGKYRAIWVYGIRNPFGLAFEPGTGRLWETEVGASSFEEVNIIRRGGNYGWPRAEGLSNNNAFVNPVHAFPPAIGRSVCGALFYPSESEGAGEGRFPERWRGKFFFVDWAAHWIKALDPASPANAQTFARHLNGPVGLDVAPDGSLFVLNRGTIWRDGKKFAANSGSLIRIRYAGDAAIAVADARPEFPRDLKASGFFESFVPPKPKKRFVPFVVNAPPWTPGLTARLWICVPPGKAIGFAAQGEWAFPEDTVVVQHYEHNSGEHRGAGFETHLYWLTGPRSARAAAYRWNPGTSETTLVEDGEIVAVPGQKNRNWFSPGLEYNLNLDSVIIGFVLPVNTRQLNRNVVEHFGDRDVNQLALWSERGWLEPAINPSEIATLPRLADLHDPDATTEMKVRSYLDVNCASCHRPGGLARSNIDARFRTPLADQHLLNGELVAGDLGIEGGRVVVPGRPKQSILLQRLNRNDFFRMPPVTVNDERPPILPVLETWIESLGTKSARLP